jgi:hypothetical protein
VRWGTKCISADEQIIESIISSAISFSEQPPPPSNFSELRPIVQNTTSSDVGASSSNDIPDMSRLSSPFYYTAIQDNKSEHSDDNFSIISDYEINRFPVPPNTLFQDNTSDFQRADGRKQRYVDYVANVLREFKLPSYEGLSTHERAKRKFLL